MALRVTMIMGQTGRYLETRRAVVPLKPISYIIDTPKNPINLPSGQDEDGTGVLLQTGTDSSHSASLRSRHRNRRQLPQLIESTDIRNRNFRQQTSLVHHGHGLNWIVALGGLTRQHDTISTVQDCIANVADFGSGRARVSGHRLQHLSSADNWLSGDIALGDHHLLCNEDLARGNLDTEITTSNHNTVSLLQNLIEVVNTLLVLNLGNDLDVFAILAENLPDGSDVATTANKRSKDHVDLVLHTKAEIGLVLLRESGEIDVRLREIDTLLRGNLSIVDALALQRLVVDDLEDLERKDTVIDVDDAAGLDHLGDVLVVDIPIEYNVSEVC